MDPMGIVKLFLVNVLGVPSRVHLLRSAGLSPDNPWVTKSPVELGDFATGELAELAELDLHVNC